MGFKSRIPQIVAAANTRIVHAIDDAGEQVQDRARARARVESGEMRDGIQWKPNDRMVIATAPHTIYNEYGTRHQAAQPGFERAIRAAYQ